jgi:hypothetical protein
MNANTRTREVVDRMFTEDEVAINVFVIDDIRSIAEALMRENVRVKSLTIGLLRSIGDAETLRDAFQVNTSVKELKLELVTADCFLALAQGMTGGQNVKKLCLKNVHRDTEEGFITFQAALRLIAPFIEDLILHLCFIGDEGAQVLAEI